MSTTAPARPPRAGASEERRPDVRSGRVGGGPFDPRQLAAALPDALRKLDPRAMVTSPVMFVVWAGSVLTTGLALAHPGDWFGWAISAWLWLTTVFANLAEAVAEGRGKAQADTLRRARTGTVARRVAGNGEESVPGTELRVGDLVVCEAGDVIPGDGDVVEGVASVDESAITGESAPVVRESGDNPLTARAVAEEAGVDDFLAEATPEDKLALIRREQAGGKLFAMTGDGTNDVPALARADVGVAMNTGTSAAKEAGNMVDLDSDPTKLIEIVAIGKQLLITRGALTTFSIANDVAKYFAIIPAMFTVAYPGLDALNVMGLASPESAILSAVIFNALIIVALVPLALRGVRYRPAGADAMLRRNLAVYGLGGPVAPFAGIKLVDLLLSLLPGIG
ncbi:HAD-IC family P-type ATPase [Streptomyces sp. NPDC088757]|uniref:HAD-IC family P-type ATPase n=1 Tax=Streptomyces sp. NPDC088757 TaxID=3365889 RepID=UPI00382E4C6E